MTTDAVQSDVHPTAVIGSRVTLGARAKVGAYTIIEDETVIGDDCVVGPFCHLGVGSLGGDDEPLVIGSEALIRSHSIFYAGARFGAGLVTGHRVTVREGTQAGANLQIGTLGDIQGNCRIGNHVRLHSNVHIGQRSVVGDFVWIFPYVVLTNDPHPPSEFQIGCTIHDFAALATMSVVLPGVVVGRGALVGAATLVREDVPDDMICVGNPGRVMGETSRIKLRDSGQPAYPWRRHFHRGYPPEVVARWQAEFPSG